MCYSSHSFVSTACFVHSGARAAAAGPKGSGASVQATASRTDFEESFSGARPARTKEENKTKEPEMNKLYPDIQSDLTSAREKNIGGEERDMGVPPTKPDRFMIDTSEEGAELNGYLFIYQFIYLFITTFINLSDLLIFIY